MTSTSNELQKKIDYTILLLAVSFSLLPHKLVMGQHLGFWDWSVSIATIYSYCWYTPSVRL